MTVHFNSRSTTDALTTVPNVRQTTGRRIRPGWTGPAAIAAVVVGGLVGVFAIQDPSPTNKATTVTAPQVETSTDAGPLIIAEEQVFIDRQHGRVPSAVPAAVVVEGDDWCATHDPC